MSKKKKKKKPQEVTDVLDIHVSTAAHMSSAQFELASQIAKSQGKQLRVSYDHGQSLDISKSNLDISDCLKAPEKQVHMKMEFTDPKVEFHETLDGSVRGSALTTFMLVPATGDSDDEKRRLAVSIQLALSQALERAIKKILAAVDENLKCQRTEQYVLAHMITTPYANDAWACISEPEQLSAEVIEAYFYAALRARIDKEKQDD